jgi:hypothetical protein
LCIFFLHHGFYIGTIHFFSRGVILFIFMQDDLIGRYIYIWKRVSVMSLGDRNVSYLPSTRIKAFCSSITSSSSSCCCC